MDYKKIDEILSEIFHEDITKVIMENYNYKYAYNRVMKELKETHDEGIYIDMIEKSRNELKAFRRKNQMASRLIMRNAGYKKYWKKGEIAQEIMIYLFGTYDQGYGFGYHKEIETFYDEKRSIELYNQHVYNNLKYYCFNICPTKRLNKLKQYIYSGKDIHLVKTRYEILEIIFG